MKSLAAARRRGGIPEAETEREVVQELFVIEQVQKRCAVYSSSPRGKGLAGTRIRVRTTRHMDSRASVNGRDLRTVPGRGARKPQSAIDAYHPPGRFLFGRVPRRLCHDNSAIEVIERLNNDEKQARI